MVETAVRASTSILRQVEASPEITPTVIGLMTTVLKLEAPAGREFKEGKADPEDLVDTAEQLILK
jgi:hypothetical protein